ncbi:acyltransferase family protein [Aliivibrio fischeri]|uniref:acyltransferase family protein n=1 Tax=Aliivibrio fischeri TaxID=668 RepID=UPI0007C490C1|nr:acyltransferase family protein [Aliivibrio fischeri]
MKYFRNDINGLRAIAVLAVVIFHFQPSLLTGGFAGVDVFFVISGFLMTKIIWDKLENNTFSIRQFYLARASRIIPALSILCLVILIYGWFHLTPSNFFTLSKHSISSIFFTSNITYSNEAGYFDISANKKWLLHTWSLSVEWQFYLLFPIFIIAIKKFFEDKVKTIIFSLMFLSFILGIYWSETNPNTSYYSLYSRAWEMLFGTIAYLYPLRIENKYKRITNFFGVILIVLSFFFISKEILWPSYFTLVPVIGTYLVIISNHQSLLTNNPIFKYVGKWSYSIYLWHWPIVVFISKHPNLWIYGILSSIVIGFISYNTIEKMKLKGKALIIIILIPLSLSFLLKVHIKSIIDMRKTKPEFILGHNSIKNNQLLYIDLENDHLLNTDEINDVDFIAIGDSNLAHYAYGITKSKKTKVLIAAAGSCLPFIDYTTKPTDKWMDSKWEHRCKELHNRITEFPTKDIILAVSWAPRDTMCISKKCDHDMSQDDFYIMIENQITQLSNIVGNKRTINLIGWVPAPKNSLVECTNMQNNIDKCQGDIFTQSLPIRLKMNNELKNISNKLKNVNFINPFNSICDSQFNCKTIQDNKNLFYDAGHLSAYGSSIVWPYIEQNLQSKTNE